MIVFELFGAGMVLLFLAALVSGNRAVAER